MKQSILNNNWEVLPENESKLISLNQRYGFSFLLSKILSTHPQINFENVLDFLEPSIKKLMPNPYQSFLDIDVAVLRMLEAIHKKQKIVVFGDYDVDGATSSALFKRYLEGIGVPCEIYIPDRIKEGYGPNSNALLNLRSKGVDLVITVDCGTVAFEPLEKAKEAGLEVIVIDHHLGVKQKPASIAVINPNRWDETSELSYLCGAGVSFMFIVALNMALKKNDYFASRKEPNLLSLIDLVALGTVCDIMPLIGLNRAFVKTGLEVIKAKTNLGIKTLLSLCGEEMEITEFTLGFVIGPRINAGGRIGKSNLGATLLSTQNEEEALTISKELCELNSKRKDIEEVSLDLAIEKIESQRLHEREVIFVEDEAFHQGIIGILSSRIKDRYGKPVGVFTRMDSYLKASFRSSNIDIGQIIHKANSAGLLIAGGGHANAGGLSVLLENYEKLFNFFEEEVKSSNKHLVNTIFASAKITPKFIAPQEVKELLKLSPFGNSNQKPIFLIEGLQVLKADIVKENHVNLILKNGNNSFRAIFFRARTLGIMPNLLKLIGKEVDIMCELSINEWNNRENININLIDIAY